MRTPSLLKSLVAVLALFLVAQDASWACDACQKDFRDKIIAERSESIHAQELLKLVKQSDWSKTQPEFAASIRSGELASNPISPPVSDITETVKPPKATTYAKAGPDGLPLTSYVEPGTKPDKKFTIEMTEGETFLGNGVVYKGFMINGNIPGPTLTMDEGDVIEFTVVNKGTVPHGVSIHAAYTQTAKYFGRIPAGESRTHLFRASYPGVFMYHCAPGGHAIPVHVLNGQYGMMVVRPKTHQYKMEEILKKKPDVEIYLLQHELFASGKDAVEGNPMYTMFNGKLFRYAESPIKAKPGDFVRIYFLNVGPNQISTFHLVGIIWDYAYWQGLPNPENTFVGGQSVLAGPTDSWIVDFRVPNDEGAYLMLTHAAGSATRGAIGILSASKDGGRTPVTLADGPTYTKDELAGHKAKAARVISPFEPGSDELRNPWRMPAGETVASVKIQGNSFYPKVIEIPVGSTVEWTNEDVFTFFDGEFAGIHNVVGYEGPQPFASQMLGHAERFSQKFDKVGEYKYMCTPHPYMKAIVRVVDK